MSRMADRSLRYLVRPDYTKLEGLAAAVVNQAAGDFLAAPPLTLHLPNPNLLAGVWALGRECLTADRSSRALREAVAAAISSLNTCPYCAGVHSGMLHGLNRPDLAEAFLFGRELKDPAIISAVQWAKATLSPDADILRAPPFSLDEAPPVIGTAVFFHYVNRMVNVFLDPSPFGVKTGANWSRSAASRLFGKAVRPRLTRQNLLPGQFLTAAPDAALPREIAWAQSNPHVFGGALRFASAAEEAGLETVDPEVRKLVLKRIENWNGETPGLGWIEPLVAPLDNARRPAARLALLVALASHQVTGPVVDGFRQRQPSDRDLVNLCAWASYAAVKRIAGWVALRVRAEFEALEKGR